MSEDFQKQIKNKPKITSQTTLSQEDDKTALIEQKNDSNHLAIRMSTK